MLVIYKAVLKVLHFLINLAFVFQIALLILVFLTASYWFLNLVDINIFDFARPIAETISSFVKIYYTRDIEVGGIYIDGSLLLFDIISLIVVFVLTKLKYYLYRTIEYVNMMIDKCLKKIENDFNAKLQKEVENEVKKCNDTAFLIEFEAKNMFSDSCWGDKNDGAKEKEQEAFKILYSALKNISSCQFAKSGDKMVILLNDFEKIDNLLIFLYAAIDRLRKNMHKKHWNIFAYVAIDIYDKNTNNFKEDVLPVLDALAGLKQKNEAVCLGNFCMRYNIKKDANFSLFKKGVYKIIGCENEVWSLVKKS